VKRLQATPLKSEPASRLGKVQIEEDEKLVNIGEEEQ
jgi:hypothetical protein